MQIDTNTLIFIILGGIIVLLIVWVVRLELMVTRMRAGTSGRRMDEVMNHISKSLAELHAFKGDAHHRIRKTEDKLQSSVRHIETLRFNPFAGTGSGGNQSFASVFVNEKGDGVVISSLYARDRVSVFSKPLSQFASTYELFDEEKEAVARAKDKLTRP